MGFFWIIDDTLRRRGFELGIAEYKRYVETKKKVHVPQKYKTDEGYLLGQWVAHQRYEKKKGRLSGDRINMLEELGFPWTVGRGRKDHLLSSE